MLIVLIILLFIGIISSSILIITNTNLIYKQDGTTFSKKIIIDYEELNGQGGVVTIERDSRTPSVADWVSFENGEKYNFFSYNNERIVKKVDIIVPKYTEKGTYYFNINYEYITGLKNSEEVSFKVI